MAVGGVYLRVLRSSPVSVIAPVHCTGPNLDANVLSSTNGRSLGTFKQSIDF